MKTFTATATTLLSLLVAAAALAQTTPAPVAEPETLVGRTPSSDAQLTGWFIAPTFTTTGFAGGVAYGPGVRGGIYLNRRLSLGVTVNALAMQETKINDHGVTKVGSYGGLLFQYVVQSNRLVHVTFESTLARGRWCNEVSDGENGRADGCAGRSFVAFEPLANVEINVARHLRIDTGVGYRFAIADASGDGPSSRDMSGLVARTSLVFGSF